MSGQPTSASLYRDVALVGAAVFVAVTLFASALSGPAVAQTPSGDAGATLAAQHTAHAAAADAADAAAHQAGAVAPRTGSVAAAPEGSAHSSMPGHGHAGAGHATAAGPSDASSAPSPTAGAHRRQATTGGSGHAHPAGTTDHHGDAGAGDGDHGDHGGETEHGEAGHAEHDGEDHADDGGDDHGEHGGHADEADPHAHHAVGCAEDHPATRALVEASRRSAERMNVGTMIAEGYIPYFDAMVPLNGATEGVGHWLNPKYIDDGVVLDPSQPESLLTDEMHRPMGFMFIQDAGVTPPPVYVNDDGTACSPWHPHTDMPARFSWWFYRQVYDGAAYNDGETAIAEETPSMMHLWFVHNPAGTFAAHDYPPASSREGVGPALPVPGGSPPSTPADGVAPDASEAPVEPGQTCPHCPEG